MATIIVKKKSRVGKFLNDIFKRAHAAYICSGFVCVPYETNTIYDLTI